MRRANGTGTIMKRNDKQRRRPYSVYLDGGHDPDTLRRIRIFLGSFEKRSEAQDFLEKYRHGLVKKKEKTVTLRDIWKLYREDKKALTGHFSANYDSDWKLYIAPKLACMDITTIKTMHMQNAINTCESAGVQRTLKAIFKGLFAYAMANDLADRDYAQALKVQTREGSTLHKPFTTEEMRWLWKNSDKEPFMLFLIQTYIGARKTELAAIKLEDVHLAERYMVGGEKTAAGRNRTIPLAKCIMPFIRHFYTISRFAGFPYLVMPDKARGLYQIKGLIHMDTLYRKNLPGHATHDARHTFVTMADNYGIPETLVKKIVGHKGHNITADVYNHKTLAQLLDVVDSLPYGPEMFVDPMEKKEEIKTG